MTLELRRWQRPGGGSVRPGAQAMGLTPGEPSPGFRELACDLAVDAASSFDRQAQLMRKWGMASVSREKTRQVVEAEGHRVSEAQHQQRFALDWQARRGADDESSTTCLGLDGVMTRQITEQEKLKRRRKTAGKRGARARAGKKLAPLAPRRKGADGPWKEVKIVGAFDQDHHHRHWRSTTQDHRMAKVLIGQVTRRVGLSPTHDTVAVVDGADWIEGRLRESLPHLNAIILDFYHLAEHVHQAMREVFGEGAPQATQWAGQLLTTIRRQGFAAFDTLLQTCLTEHAAPAGADDAIRQLRHYVTQRREMVNYPNFKARGWPIGSGPTESMAGVLTARIKGRGRRWDAANIDALMALEALGVNGESQAYWQTQASPPPRCIAA